MLFTVLMFFVLILCFAAMLGFVKFSENVIAKPQVAPLNDNTAAQSVDGAKSN